jgi:hypothetical protein
MQAVNQLGDANEVLNERAVAVMARMSDKLTGRDFSSGSALAGAGSSTQHGSEHLASGDARDVQPCLSVKVQVQKLILQATSHENLCQNYVGYESIHTSPFLAAAPRSVILGQPSFFFVTVCYSLFVACSFHRWCPFW